MKGMTSIFWGSMAGLMLLSANSTFAQDFQPGINVWNDEQVNQLTNIRYGGLNPTFLTFNDRKTSALVKIDYALTRGDFHAIDQSGKQNDLNVFFGGLKQLGKLNLFGYLRYTNTQAKNHTWNSTLYLNENNPFILGDSIKSNVTTEAFDMHATGSYTFAPAWIGALDIGLKVGTSSDQTDPRPETNSSKIPITAGLEWHPQGNWSVGLSGMADLYHSDLSYMIVNNLVTYRYFLMKGMGDYFRRSTGDESGYKREYKGTTWTGAIHTVWQPENCWRDFFELRAGYGTEDAEDGGSSYTFKGGDYHFTNISILNRLQYRETENILHQLILSAKLQSGDGTWYDQKKVVDTEHANRTYYEILSKTKIQQSDCLSGNLTYRLDFMNQHETNFYVSGNLGLDKTTVKHFTDDGTLKQDYTVSHLNLDLGKSWKINHQTLSTSVYAGYYFTLGNRNFATASPSGNGEDMTQCYVAPLFEYATAKHINLGSMADYKMPLKSTNNKLMLGVYAKICSNLYNDNSKYSNYYQSSSLTNVDFGLYLTF
jgi:hypothetical protein